MSTPSPASSSAPTNFRWVICALLFWVTTANYLDRNVFGNLKPELPGYLKLEDEYRTKHASELQATHQQHPQAAADIQSCDACKKFVHDRVYSDWDEQYWNMTVVFQAFYAVSNLFMGWFMDKIGLRWGFVIACIFWGLASISHAFAPQIGILFGSTVAGFYVCRALLGLGEGGNFPAANKAVAEWFPKRERALANSLFNSGSNVGGLLVPIALPTIVGLSVGSITLGWRGAFLLTAVIDLLWIAAWLLFYRKPEVHPKVNKEELTLIQSDVKEPTVRIPWRRLLPHKQMWAFAVPKLMTDCFWWFYLVGSPDFFSKKFGLDADGRKYQLIVIYVVSSFAGVAGGWLAGIFIKQARKITMLICATLVIPVVYSGFTDSKWIAAALITLAASAHQAWSANVFALAGDMFPKRVVGSVTGLGGMLGSVGGIILFTVTGKVLKASGNYMPVFVMASIAYVIALAIIHTLVPILEQARIDENTAA